MSEGGGVWPILVLCLWPVVTLVFFFTMRPERAALASIFGGLLFLPEVTSFRLPMLPPFTKQTIPYLSVLLAYTVRRPKRVWRLPEEKWVLLVVAALVVDGIGIWRTNRDPLVVGDWHKLTLPGLTFTDGMFLALDNIFTCAIPFFLGGVIVRDVNDLLGLLRTLVKAALVYSFFALIELRMSPQLHRWIYGFAQHSFSQAIRFGGYRPMIFMAHGLAVGLFFSVSLMASTGLPAGVRVWRMKPRTVFIYLAIMVLLCKSTSAAVYALACVPIMVFAKPRKAQKMAMVLAAVVLAYPSLRQAGLFPTEQVVSAATSLVGAERAESMAFRFRNEDALTEKARERPWFGWGAYGRNVNYDENARPVSVTDGLWIIDLSMGGMMAFASLFGLLVIPIFLAAKRLGKLPPDETRLVSSLSLMVAVTAIDLLPNGLFSNYPYFLSGALLAVSQSLVKNAKTERATGTASGAGPVRLAVPGRFSAARPRAQ